MEWLWTAQDENAVDRVTGDGCPDRVVLTACVHARLAVLLPRRIIVGHQSLSCDDEDDPLPSSERRISVEP